jgi:hypothetical protein
MLFFLDFDLTDLPEEEFAGRRKCRVRIEALDGTAFEREARTRPDMSVAQVLLHNMRHVQHHTAQLNLILRQRTDTAPPKWVSKAKGAG